MNIFPREFPLLLSFQISNKLDREFRSVDARLLQIYAFQMFFFGCRSISNMFSWCTSNTNGSLWITQALLPLTAGYSRKTPWFTMQIGSNLSPWMVMERDDDGVLLNCPWIGFSALRPISIRVDFLVWISRIKKNQSIWSTILWWFVCCNYTKRSIIFCRVFNVCPTTMLLLFFFSCEIQLHFVHYF